ncbi:MAG TPA: hypothetical protein VFI23_08495 [Rhizomicrobium sp.]|nr:hypothetical protein [Rhizomicrobium sp.]
MDIHKPHAAKTWKEFFIELGTITLGIVIAISLEQLVESWHWAGEVKEARKAIIEEMAANNANLLAIRIAIAPCVEKQLNEADAVLTALEAGGKSAGLTHFRRPIGSLLRDSEWQSERASQVLTHFPRDELAIMSRYYAHLQDFKAWEIPEIAAWRELGILQKPPAGMTTSDLIRLRIALASARSWEGLTALNARRELKLIMPLGVGDLSADPIVVKNYCAMNDADYSRFRASQDLR